MRKSEGRRKDTLVQRPKAHGKLPITVHRAGADGQRARSPPGRPPRLSDLARPSIIQFNPQPPPPETEESSLERRCLREAHSVAHSDGHLTLGSSQAGHSWEHCWPPSPCLKTQLGPPCLGLSPQPPANPPR